jgi:ATP/ADP translocase
MRLPPRLLWFLDGMFSRLGLGFALGIAWSVPVLNALPRRRAYVVLYSIVAVFYAVQGIVLWREKKRLKQEKAAIAQWIKELNDRTDLSSYKD